MQVYAWFTQSLRTCLRRVYAGVIEVYFMQSLRMVYAWCTHGLRMVYAWFTQILRKCLCKVYAEFTQSLRRLCRVYAEFTQVYAVLVHAVSCVNLARDFTGLRMPSSHGLRRFTHSARKPE